MSTSLERLQYGFDRDSRRTWRRRVLATGEDYAYGYDGLSQVVSAARGNLNLNASAIAAVPVAAESWDYDPTGNWQGYQTQAGGTVMVDQQRVHDQGNRLTQVSGNEFPIVLDRVGRMLEVPPDASGDWSDSMSITWDAWSRIVEITYPAPGSVLGNYAYDGLSRRITRTVAGTLTHTYYSDAWRPLEDRASDNTTVENQYLWGARHRDDLVRADLGTGSGGGFAKSRYVLMDYFSPAAITDVTGAVMERYAFSAFGVRRILAPDFSARSISECGFEFAFQGQFQDTETSLLNYGYRYYSPQLGRWLCKDPIEEAGSRNLYAYSAGSPTNCVDYLGLCDCDIDFVKPTYEFPANGGYGLTKSEITAADVNCTKCSDKKQCWHATFTFKIRVTTQIQPKEGDWGSGDSSQFKDAKVAKAWNLNKSGLPDRTDRMKAIKDHENRGRDKIREEFNKLKEKLKAAENNKYNDYQSCLKAAKEALGNAYKEMNTHLNDYDNSVNY